MLLEGAAEAREAGRGKGKVWSWGGGAKSSLPLSAGPVWTRRIAAVMGFLSWLSPRSCGWGALTTRAFPRPGGRTDRRTDRRSWEPRALPLAPPPPLPCEPPQGGLALCRPLHLRQVF